MGRYGFKSGYIKAQNIQAGTVDITTDANGDGTASVTFKKPMKGAKTPAVVLTAQEADTTGTLCAKSITATGFIAQVDGSSVTSGILTVGYIAFDDSLN